MTTRSLPRLAVAIVIGIVAIACSDGASTSTSTPEEPPSSTTGTSSSSPTSTQPSSTTSPATSTTTTVPTTVVDTNSLASGSGCTPGLGDLPDGRWFGYLGSLDETAMEFDLACWFSGDAAIAATAEDGEESPPPNDYYIRNVSRTVRTVAVAADATVRWLPQTGDPATEETVSYGEWLVYRDARAAQFGDYQPGLWIDVEEGEIVVIQEQYQP